MAIAIDSLQAHIQQDLEKARHLQQQYVAEIQNQMVRSQHNLTGQNEQNGWGQAPSATQQIQRAVSAQQQSAMQRAAQVQGLGLPRTPSARPPLNVSSGAMQAPISVLSDLWTVRWGDEWVTKVSLEDAEDSATFNWITAAERLAQCGKLEEYERTYYRIIT